jgi:diguanylate cyclase (GGDEF)-like protein
MSSTTAPAWRWPALTLTFALVLLPTVLVGGPASDGAFLLGMATASAVAWSGVRRRRLHRRAVVCLAAGVSLFALGDGVRLLVPLPGLSAVDVGYVLAYLSVAIGIRLLLSHARDRDPHRAGFVDAAVTFVVLAYLEWELVLGVGAGGQQAAPTIWGLHTLLDAALVAGCTWVWIARRSLRRSAGLLGLTTSLWFVADLALLRSGAAASDQEWVLAAWLLAAGCLAAAVRALPQSATTPAGLDGQRVTPPWIAFVLTPVLIPPSFELASYLGGHDISPAPGILATVALLGLVFIRAAHLQQDGVAMRHRLHSQARFFSALAANSSDALVLLDADSRVIQHPIEREPLDQQLVPLLRGGDGLRAALAEDHADTRALVARARRVPGVVVTGQLCFRSEPGSVTWFNVRVVDLLADPDVAAVVVTGHDVTERTVAQQELARRSLHDELTGLANRALFDDRLGQALRRGERSGHAPAVLSLDLDGFRGVNDSLGHSSGDQMLRIVADRLRAAVRSGDTVSRLGGDQFAILVEDDTSALEEAQAVANRVQDALAAPMSLAGRRVSISAGLGLAGAETEATPSMVLRDADIALHRAKAAGRGRLVVFHTEMRTAALERVRLEADLAQALERGELHLAFQPVLALDSERLVGFEALLRWTHTTLGAIPPDMFIPIAESTGLIHEFGQWVLEQACHTTAAWQRSYPDVQPLSIAVNISGRQLEAEDFSRFVAEVLDSSGLPPHSLVLELTETTLVDDPTRAAADLGRLRELGIRLAIDDFGTGYASLAYLSQFPVDIVKIDRSFIATITEADHRPAIVRGMLELARTLGLETIAEGVDSAIQRDRLRAERCDMVQGYLFARPLDYPEAELQLMKMTSPR